ncbi:MAG: hypothetical protein K1X88_22070 [Nannocystaceae bacterium]|nr:hypothetical protein [Nannocystaceae bacterium]
MASLRPVPVLVVLAALAAGAFALGRATAGTTPAPAAPAAAPAAEPSPGPRALRSLVCAPVQRRASAEASCEELELRQRWCESELSECTRERSAVRHAWPEQDSIESPDRWSATIDEAFERCGIEAELEVVDCAEYPCTAALRPRAPITDGAGHEQQMNALMAAVRACAPLREAFAVGSGQDDALDVFRLDAPCGGTHERFFALLALDTRGEAFTKQQEGEDDLVEREVMRWMYRRGDDLVGLWPCRDRAGG